MDRTMQPPAVKAVVTLIACAPILTEIASGNTPARALLDPRIDLFLVLAYSLPVLVIRELAIRQRLGGFGLFLLGLAYGIWNEGLLAQTLLRFEHVPIDRFDHYIYAGGFNFSWAAVIVPWHALMAVAFPMTLVHGLFPPEARAPWLGRRVFSALAAVLIALIVVISVARRPHAQMLACLFSIGLLVTLAFLFRRSETREPKEDSHRAYPFGFGAAAYLIWIIGAILLAAHRVPAAVYFAAVCGSLALLAVLSARLGLTRLGAAARLALGAYFAAAGFNAAAGVATHSVAKCLTGLILAIIFAVTCFAVLPRTGTAPETSAA